MTAPGENERSAPVELPVERADPLDPPPALKDLRESRPMCPMRYPDGHVGWLSSDHELARGLLGDPRFSMRPTRFPAGDGEKQTEVLARIERELSELERGSLLALDPPEHPRLRRLLAGHFTVRRVQEHGAAIEQIVEARLDAMEAIGEPVDLVEEFALPIPSMTVCEMLGVPVGEREEFERPARVHLDFNADVEDRIAALRELLTFVKGVVAEKREQPAGDLLSEVIASGELSDDELAGIAAVLFDAGHQTTAMMIALGTYALLRDRSQWDHLRDHPEAIENGVEELLRYITIFHLGAMVRTASEDFELGDAQIKSGESITVSLAAANRDPEQFPNPDRLDVCRDASRHVAFGHGRHMCLGQHLARLELKIALAGLMRRFPTLRLANPDERFSMHSEHLLYGIDRLPVAWS